MATSVQRTHELTMADVKGKVDPDWCPGCGDFGVLAAVQKALVELRIPTHNIVTISGIGCSSNFPGYMNTYGMHTLHGRALAVATGVKLANHDLTVLVTGGDGDGFGIGGNHFMHTMRRRTRRAACSPAAANTSSQGSASEMPAARRNRRRVRFMGSPVSERASLLQRVATRCHLSWNILL